MMKIDYFVNELKTAYVTKRNNKKNNLTRYFKDKFGELLNVGNQTKTKRKMKMKFHQTEELTKLRNIFLKPYGLRDDKGKFKINNNKQKMRNI